MGLKSEIADLKTKVHQRYRPTKGYRPVARFFQSADNPALWVNLATNEVMTLTESRALTDVRIVRIFRNCTGKENRS